MNVTHYAHNLAGGAVLIGTLIANVKIDADWLKAAANAPLMAVCLATLFYSYVQDKRRAEERVKMAEADEKLREKRAAEDAQTRRALFDLIQQNAILMTEVRDRVQRCPVVEYREVIGGHRNTSGVPVIHRDYGSEKDVPRPSCPQKKTVRTTEETEWKESS